MVVDINDEKGSFTPDVNHKEENPKVTFPLREGFADDVVC